MLLSRPLSGQYFGYVSGYLNTPLTLRSTVRFWRVITDHCAFFVTNCCKDISGAS
jgi:hypothetical protein